ncbi:hypothetical protein H5410_002801 [Solanum commersonii]|uniref:Uncharacterized protein n=1 Tax=Solanum commersonii TaxID=4109 RepID=A0A9J6B370_SOLCO|nr:hypothetical protein H5410_002801 [Solanum commersonii]
MDKLREKSQLGDFYIQFDLPDASKDLGEGLEKKEMSVGLIVNLIDLPRIDQGEILTRLSVINVENLGI